MNIFKLTLSMIIAIFVFCIGLTNLLAGDSLSAKGEVIKITRASEIAEVGNLNSPTINTGFNSYLYVKDASGKEIRFYIDDATKYKGIKEGEDIKAGDIVLVTYQIHGKPYITVDEETKTFKSGVIELNDASLVEVVKKSLTTVK